VKLENCIVEGPFRSIIDDGKSGYYHFSGCNFNNVSESFHEKYYMSENKNLVFDRCTIIVMDRKSYSNYRRQRKIRNLTEINPLWEK